MAIDTAEKRFSMLNFGDGTHIHMTFQADGAVSADDRFHLLDLYSGFGTTGAVTRRRIAATPELGYEAGYKPIDTREM